MNSTCRSIVFSSIVSLFFVAVVVVTGAGADAAIVGDVGQSALTI